MASSDVNIACAADVPVIVTAVVVVYVTPFLNVIVYGAAASQLAIDQPAVPLNVVAATVVHSPVTDISEFSVSVRTPVGDTLYHDIPAVSIIMSAVMVSVDDVVIIVPEV